MDSIFLLNDGDRATFLQHIMQAFGCTYICLWSYFPQPPNSCLIYLDGLYHEENNQASSSSGSLSRRLFDEYRKTIFLVDDGRIPGFAFKNSLHYFELKDLDLPRLVSNQAQFRFYQEARIKTAIFMGCKTGEIELGMSNDTQVNLEMEMKNWFPEDFSRQTLPRELIAQPIDQNRPSSSSSSLRSLSLDSPEPSPVFLFNIPNTSYINPEVAPKEAPVSTTTSTSPVHQAIQALSQIRNTQFPTIESEDAAITKAMLAVISSSSTTTTTTTFSSSSHQNASAFKSYRTTMSGLGPITQRSTTTRVRRQNLLKRAITFFTSLNLMRTQTPNQGTRPTTTQLHHMISERRRREKLNESFQALRSLLPPGSKRDKASVLTSTNEYLTSLKAQVAELSKRNLILEAQLPRKEAATDDQEEVMISGSSSSVERVNVRITPVAESTSEARMVDLQVTLRGGEMLDLVIRVLEFLKQVQNVSLMSVEAETRVVETSTVNRVVLRLKIQGGEWDESSFQEAVRRVVGS